MRTPTLLLALTLLAGCKTPQEQLAAARMETARIMDALWADYSGKGAQGADSAARQEGGGLLADLARGLGNLAEDVGRGVLEEQCVAVGAGQKPGSLSQRTRDFFAREDVRKQCHDVFLLREKITRLEAELRHIPPPGN